MLGVIITSQELLSAAEQDPSVLQPVSLENLAELGGLTVGQYVVLKGSRGAKDFEDWVGRCLAGPLYEQPSDWSKDVPYIPDDVPVFFSGTVAKERLDAKMPPLDPKGHAVAIAVPSNWNLTGRDEPADADEYRRMGFAVAADVRIPPRKGHAKAENPNGRVLQPAMYYIGPRRNTKGKPPGGLVYRFFAPRGRTEILRNRAVSAGFPQELALLGLERICAQEEEAAAKQAKKNERI